MASRVFTRHAHLRELEHPSRRVARILAGGVVGFCVMVGFSRWDREFTNNQVETALVSDRICSAAVQNIGRVASIKSLTPNEIDTCVLNPDPTNLRATEIGSYVEFWSAADMRADASQQIELLDSNKVSHPGTLLLDSLGAGLGGFAVWGLEVGFGPSRRVLV